MRGGSEARDSFITHSYNKLIQTHFLSVLQKQDLNSLILYQSGENSKLHINMIRNTFFVMPTP